jgi:hypothetical protein
MLSLKRQWMITALVGAGLIAGGYLLLRDQWTL